MARRQRASAAGHPGLNVLLPLPLCRADDMKTKNRADRGGAVPAAPSAAAAAGAGAAGPPKAAAKAAGPPRVECEQGRKWVVENQVGAWSCCCCMFCQPPGGPGWGLSPNVPRLLALGCAAARSLQPPSSAPALRLLCPLRPGGQPRDCHRPDRPQADGVCLQLLRQHHPGAAAGMQPPLTLAPGCTLCGCRRGSAAGGCAALRTANPTPLLVTHSLTFLSSLQVRGKVNAITLDKCTRTGLLFEAGKRRPPAPPCPWSARRPALPVGCALGGGPRWPASCFPQLRLTHRPAPAPCPPCPPPAVVATCELVNSSSVEVQCTGAVPTVAVDKCDGCQVGGCLLVVAPPEGLQVWHTRGASQAAGLGPARQQLHPR